MPEGSQHPQTCTQPNPGRFREAWNLSSPGFHGWVAFLKFDPGIRVVERHLMHTVTALRGTFHAPTSVRRLSWIRH